MTAGLVRLRLAGLTRRIGIISSTLPLTEQWRKVDGPNSPHSSGGRDHQGPLECLSLSGYAAMLLGVGIQFALAEEVSVGETNGGLNDSSRAYISEGGLRSIENGEVISNIHTAKWRVFTDKGRDLFSQGDLDEAEKCFSLALEEAKKGFGERDPHVASACNNLAELFRMKGMFEKAEPLYIEAIELLEQSLGPEDVRVAFALHNLGGFYLMQHKLEQARTCYERALKIKGRVLGLNHLDYANTMFHLGEVLRLQGKTNDAEALIRDSIRVLEEGGQGQSQITIKRMSHLAQMLLESNRLQEAESLQRKILHILELSKGWDSLNTVAAAEQLAVILQSVGNLNESQELLERCLEVRQSLLHENHIQVGATKLKLARVLMLKSSRLRRVNVLEAKLELEKAKALLSDAIRIAESAVPLSGDAIVEDTTFHKRPQKEEKDAHAAQLILMQSLDALGLLEISKLELHEVAEESEDIADAEKPLRRCISAMKKPGIPESILRSEPIKREYLSCLRHLAGLLNRVSVEKKRRVTEELRELRKEIIQIEAELGQRGRFFK